MAFSRAAGHRWPIALLSAVVSLTGTEDSQFFGKGEEDVFVTNDSFFQSSLIPILKVRHALLDHRFGGTGAGSDNDGVLPGEPCVIHVRRLVIKCA